MKITSDCISAIMSFIHVKTQSQAYRHRLSSHLSWLTQFVFGIRASQFGCNAGRNEDGFL